MNSVMRDGKRGSSALVTALIYTRVSSDEQAREGVSLDAQLAECRRYAAPKGWVLGHEYQDVMSGTRDDRRDYQALLAEARRLRAEGHAVVVVVLRLDRFGRRVLERVRCREELKGLGVATHSVREGGEVSDLVANILAAVAQEEVERLGQRVRDSFAYLTAKGWAKPGAGAFGYRWRPATAEERKRGAPNSVLEIDPDAAHLGRAVFARADEGVTMRALSRWMAGLPSELRGGRAWSYPAIRYLLTCETYIGRFDDGRRGNWEPLIDEAQFARVRARLDGHRHMPRQASGRYLLTGLLRCPQCGGRMQGALGNLDRRPRDNGTTGHRLPPRYACHAAALGASTQIGSAPTICRFAVNAQKLDAQARDQVSAMLETMVGDKNFWGALNRAWTALGEPQAGMLAPHARALEQAAEKARERIKRLALLFADGDLDREGYELGRAQAQSDLSAAEAELGKLRPSRPTPALPPLEDVLRDLGGWAEALRDGDLAGQRDILGLLVERLDVERLGFGKFALNVRWTHVGHALAQLRGRSAEAA